MKVLLKNYVSVVEVPDGVLFSAGGQSFVLKGNGLFPVISKLLLRLDGTKDVATIDREIPEKLRPIFGKLLARLEADNMVLRIPNERQPDQSAVEQRLYDQTLRFLANETSNYKSYFAEWRSEALLVVGGGVSCASLLRGLAACGAGKLFVHDCDSESTKSLLAHRLLLSDVINESREQGYQFSADLLDEYAVVDAVRAGTARLIYCADELCASAGGRLFERLMPLARTGSMFGGVYRGHGLVGPRLNGEPSNHWLDAWQRATPDPDAAFPQATLSIIGSLMAFEALKAKLYLALEGTEQHWDCTHFYAISPVGDISTHTARPTIIKPVAHAPKPDNKGGEEWRLAERSRVEAGMLAAFDPLVGAFTWVELDAPDFPLQHRSIRIRGGGALRETVITRWGITPQDAAMRAICAATEAYGALSSSETPPTPIVAAVSESEWRDLAQAHALVLNDGWVARAIVRRVDPIDVADPSLQMLLRLARLYTEAVPELTIAISSGHSGAVARACVGKIDRVAAGPNLVAACITALGAALSAWQRMAEELDHGSVAKAWRSALTQHADKVGLSELVAAPLAPPGEVLCFSEHRLTLPLIGSGPLVLGWVTADAKP